MIWINSISPGRVAKSISQHAHTEYANISHKLMRFVRGDGEMTAWARVLIFSILIN